MVGSAPLKLGNQGNTWVSSGGGGGGTGGSFPPEILT